MRQDIREGVVWYIMHNIEPNFSAMSRQFNCDYRTGYGALIEPRRRVKLYHSNRSILNYFCGLFLIFKWYD